MITFSSLGLHVLVNPNLPPDKQFRFPRSKKKRIRRKWAKDKRNIRRGEDVAFRFGDKLMVSPAMYNALMCHIVDTQVQKNLYEEVWKGEK